MGPDLAALVQSVEAVDRAQFDADGASEFYSRSGTICATLRARGRHGCPRRPLLRGEPRLKLGFVGLLSGLDLLTFW